MKRFTIREIDGENVLFQNITGEASVLAAIWPASGVGSAPAPADFSVGAVGADLLGINTALTYHIVNNAGTKSWVPTGGTVQQLYGGA